MQSTERRRQLLGIYWKYDIFLMLDNFVTQKIEVIFITLCWVMYKPKAFVQIKLPSEFWAGKRVSKLKHRDGLPWRTSAIITWYRRPIYCCVLKIWFIEMVGNKFQDLKANDLSCQVGSCDHLTSASYNPDWTCQRVRIEQKILNHKYLTFFTTRYFLIFGQLGDLLINCLWWLRLLEKMNDY